MSLVRYAVAFGLIVAAVGAKEYRLGYIDSEQIIARYEAAKDAKKELEEEIASYQAQADSLKQEYEQALDEYKSQELTLSPEGKRAKQAEVDQRKKRYDGFVEQVYREGGKIDQKNKELIAPIVEKINEAVSKLAKDGGFSMVLDAGKEEVVYAEAGMDLTEQVLAELNKEVAPTGPTTLEKTYYAIAPVYETNDEARQDRIGAQIRQFSYDLVRAQPKVEMAANADFEKQLADRGLSGQQVLQQQAVDVARALSANFVLFGECAKEDRRITFTLSIADVQLNTLVKTESGTANRVEELREQVARVVQVLLTSVTKP